MCPFHRPSPPPPPPLSPPPVTTPLARPARSQVRGVPPSEAKVFTEYVLPSLSLLPSEAELAVQVRGGRLSGGRRRLQAGVGP